MNILKSILLFIFFFSAIQTIGQKSLPTFKINAILIDPLNKQPISFASIYKSRGKKGTISNYNGEFIIDNVQEGDSIICSYIGYERLTFVANTNLNYDTLFLQREVQLIDEVSILANDAFLYNLVSNARKTNSSEKKVAKTYFEMETFHDETQLEFFQGYYNGTYKGYDVSNLEMKNARFALAPIGNRIFVSTETSKSMYMESLVNSDRYFPIGPNEMKARKLRKSYKLSLSTKFKNQNKKTIYAIHFKPKKNTKQYFQGTIWIDSLSNNIIKINLRVDEAEIHPFQPLWSIHSLEKVNLELSKSFTELNGEMFLKSMDFNYNLTYKSETDSSFNISSRAVLYAFNFEEEFILPFFKFTEVSNADYRKIQMLPENQLFWECTDEFKVESISEKLNHFLDKEEGIKNYDFFSTDTIFKKPFFENAYATWNGNRFLLREELNDSSVNDLSKTIFLTNRYHLEVQFFMDINKLCDSLQIITKTVFDTFRTYYKFPMTKEGQAFINIYFDLMEIERRKMHAEILKCGNDISMIQMRYNEGKAQAEKMSETYFKEMQRGTNQAQLIKWNALVLDELNIDNILIFGIDL